MKEIAVYVEGGGDTAQQRAELRNGFDALLQAQKQAARAKQLRWKLVPCGGRDRAYQAFLNAIEQAADETLLILLVDSEERVADETGNEVSEDALRIRHLEQRDHWRLHDVEPSQVYLMVQCMETWIVSDAEALARYYGSGFRANQLPIRGNLEEEPKTSVLERLKQATRETTKGEYAKIKHASKLLAAISPAKVMKRCAHFKTFTAWLADQIETA